MSKAQKPGYGSNPKRHIILNGPVKHNYLMAHVQPIAPIGGTTLHSPNLCVCSPAHAHVCVCVECIHRLSLSLPPLSNIDIESHNRLSLEPPGAFCGQYFRSSGGFGSDEGPPPVQLGANGGKWPSQSVCKNPLLCNSFVPGHTFPYAPRVSRVAMFCDLFLNASYSVLVQPHGPTT